MARLTTIDPAAATGKVKEIFDGPLKSMHINIFKGMANSAVGLQFYLGAAGALAGATLSTKEQEVIHLALSQANGCEYCLAAHTVIGKGAGLTEGETVAARKVAMSDPRLNALARFASALNEKRGQVSDADLSAFKGAGFTDGQVVEVIAVYALAMYTNVFNHVNRTTVDFPPPPRV